MICRVFRLEVGIFPNVTNNSPASLLNHYLTIFVQRCAQNTSRCRAEWSFLRLCPQASGGVAVGRRRDGDKHPRGPLWPSQDVNFGSTSERRTESSWVWGPRGAARILRPRTWPPASRVRPAHGRGRQPLRVLARLLASP